VSINGAKIRSHHEGHEEHEVKKDKYLNLRVLRVLLLRGEMSVSGLVAASPGELV
jgi:hypothetical protein